MRYILLGFSVVAASVSVWLIREQAKEERSLRWKQQLVIEIETGTTRMYECTSEIYARLDSKGPICADACARYAAFIEKQKNPPDYIHEHFTDIPESPKFCSGKP